MSVSYKDVLYKNIQYYWMYMSKALNEDLNSVGLS